MEKNFEKRYVKFYCPLCRCDVIKGYFAMKGISKSDLEMKKNRFVESHMQLHRKSDDFDKILKILGEY